MEIDINIVVFIPTLTSGGAEKQATLLAKTLQSYYYTTLVVWYGNKVDEKFRVYISENNINCIFLEGAFYKKFYKLLSILHNYKIKIIFNFLASNNLYGSIAGKLAGVPLIIGGIRNSKISFKKFLIQRFLHNYVLKYTIFNNYSGKDELIRRGFLSRKCIVIPNCFEIETLPIYRTKKEFVTIVSLARFVPQKDFLTALTSIQYLIQFYNITSFRFIIIGYGELEVLINEWVINLNLQDFVEIIIKPINALEIMEKCDIFLSTSLFEGTSNSIMEAMSLSLPVVATDVGDNNVLVKHNLNGFIAPVRDFTKIAEYLYILISQADLRSSFGVNSHNRLSSLFSYPIFERGYLDFISEIVK